MNNPTMNATTAPAFATMLTRQADAFERFALAVAELGGISVADAREVVAHYRKLRVLNTKHAAVSGFVTVKHGGFLAPDVIRRALAELSK